MTTLASTRAQCTRAVKAMSNGSAAEQKVLDTLVDNLQGFQLFRQPSKWLYADKPSNSIILHRPLDQNERLYRRAKRNDIKVVREGLPDLDIEVQHMDKWGTIENKICMTITDSINPPAETASNINILVLTGEGFNAERRLGWRKYNQQKGGRVNIMGLVSLKHHCDTGFKELNTFA